MLIREGGSCGDDVNVYVSNDSENRDNYLEIAEEFGGGPYVIGENWVVEMPYRTHLTLLLRQKNQLLISQAVSGRGWHSTTPPSQQMVRSVGYPSRDGHLRATSLA